MTILLTGYTGNVGGEIARLLAPHRVLALVRDAAAVSHLEGVEIVEGCLAALPAGRQGEVEAIVHSAASVAFRSSLEDLRRTNVEGTRALLDYARGCPRLRRFLHISSICVYGDQMGAAPEAPVVEIPHFVNAYEQSKWEAERLVLGSDLPTEIVRLGIVAGSERDGSVRRTGALHQALYWLFKGLIPMIPGTPDARVDLISTEFAAGVIAATFQAPPNPGRIVHASAGKNAPRLAELLEFLGAFFAPHHRGWASGAIARPDIVDRETFALFEKSVHQSGDLLFQRVCADAQSFLPMLLYPRTMSTSLAQAVPSAEWPTLVRRVADWLIATGWNRRSLSIP